MMRGTSPFDHQPDRELGRALRDLLSAPDDAAFADRVLAAATWSAPQADAEWWVVLHAWSRRGLAAAALLIGIGGFMMARPASEADAPFLDEPLASSGTPSALFAGAVPPDVDVVLGTALVN